MALECAMWVNYDKFSILGVCNENNLMSEYIDLIIEMF